MTNEKPALSYQVNFFARFHRSVLLKMIVVPHYQSVALVLFINKQGCSNRLAEVASCMFCFIATQSLALAVQIQVENH